jgi:hypothetical protein
MKTTQDIKPRLRTSTLLRDPTEDLPSVDVNEAPVAERQTDTLATGAPLGPLEEIKRKFGPDILRPASLLPRKAAKHTATEYKTSKQRSGKPS